VSNPTTLQELADSLAAIAELCRVEATAASAANNGPGAIALYARREAHLDVRATVLAMIAQHKCAACDGVDGPEVERCPECHGYLDVGHTSDCPIEAHHQSKRPVCDECGGSGINHGQECWQCGGTGVL